MEHFGMQIKHRLMNCNALQKYIYVGLIWIVYQWQYSMLQDFVIRTEDMKRRIFVFLHRNAHHYAHGYECQNM